MATPIDIQAELDRLLEENPDAKKYVTKLWYLPAGQSAPPEVTHVVAIASATSSERQLRIGCVVVPQYAALLDALLAMVATQPPPAKKV